MKNKLILKICLSIFSFIFILLIIEFSLRYYRIGDDERNLLYQHVSDLGWFPQPNISREFTGAVKIKINHNAERKPTNKAFSELRNGPKI